MGYRGKVKERERARRLRARGLTLNEIAGHLGVSKSSVSLWVRGVEFTPRLLTNRNFGPRNRPPNKLQRAKQAEIERLKAEGRRRIGELSDREALMAGLALYAGEGGKTDGTVAFANTNPQMIAFFMAWLRRFFDIDEAKLRVRLYLHEGLDLDAAIGFWSGLTGVPPAQFGKPYRAVADPSIRRAKHPLGCPRVDYCSTTIHRTIMGLIEALLSSAPFRGSSIGGAGDC